MLLLAIDTSGKHGSLAVARCERGGPCDVIEVVPLAGGTFSAQLVPQVAELLAKHEFSKQQIGGFAVASGPGSFTGLRVGLAAIKALAEVLDKPIAAVSLLQVLARAAGNEGAVLAAMDAGRGEIYAGEYEVSAGKARLIEEKLMSQAEFLTLASGRTVVTADSSIANAAQAGRLTVRNVERPLSDAVARLGWEKIESGDTVSPEQLEANYIGRSDSEIFSKPGS